LSGFDGLPAGFAISSGAMMSRGLNASWWSIDQVNTKIMWANHCSLDYYGDSASLDYSLKQSGFSVRCIKNY
jgi:uncharacterized protein (TIGR02145 family)